MKNKIIQFLRLSLLGFLFCSLPVNAELEDGLVADYPFDGNANDASGNGNNGTVNGAQLSADRFGNPNSAFSFDGADDFISIGNGVKPPMPLTVNVWFNLDTIGNFIPLFRNDRLDGGSFRNGVFLSIRNNKLGTQILSGFSVQSTRKGVITANDVFEVGKWTMMTAVFESVNNFHIYVNGSEQSVVPNTGTGNSLTYSTADGAIGSVDNTTNNASVFTSNFFDGSIDDVKVYNRTLTDSEIQELFLEGTDACTEYSNATITPNLDIHLPSLNYQSLTGALNLWVDLEFYGREEGNLLWKLKGYGEHKGSDVACESDDTITVLPNLDIQLLSIDYQLLAGTINLWANFEYYGQGSQGELIWKLLDYGENQ